MNLPRAALSLCLSLTTSVAFAQTVCSTCEDCTQALAAANADVRLGGDLPLRGAGPCITVRGENARLDGARHVVLAQPAGGVGVRVEGAGANVRNLRVTGAATGVAVAARDVTLYQVVTEARAQRLRTPPQRAALPVTCRSRVRLWQRVLSARACATQRAPAT